VKLLAAVSNWIVPPSNIEDIAKCKQRWIWGPPVVTALLHFALSSEWASLQFHGSMHKSLLSSISLAAIGAFVASWLYVRRAQRLLILTPVLLILGLIIWTKFQSLYRASWQYIEVGDRYFVPLPLHALFSYGGHLYPLDPWNLGYWLCLGLLSATVWACRRFAVSGSAEFSNDPPVGSPYLIFLWLLLFDMYAYLMPTFMGTPWYYPSALNRHVQNHAYLISQALDLYGEENRGVFPEDAIQATAAIHNYQANHGEPTYWEMLPNKSPWGIPDRLGQACDHVKEASMPPPGPYSSLGNAVRRPHPQDCRDLGAILYEVGSDKRSYRLHVIGQRGGKAILFSRIEGPRISRP